MDGGSEMKIDIYCAAYEAACQCRLAPFPALPQALSNQTYTPNQFIPVYVHASLR